jgi:hypothetical protein
MNSNWQETAWIRFDFYHPNKMKLWIKHKSFIQQNVNNMPVWVCQFTGHWSKIGTKKDLKSYTELGLLVTIHWFASNWYKLQIDFLLPIKHPVLQKIRGEGHLKAEEGRRTKLTARRSERNGESNTNSPSLPQQPPPLTTSCHYLQ